ncbi:hypothetical protein KIN20_036147 [Parelaphostrongylus tenuis]|uniref:Arrestin C-terminal-like domain-containing protein n=1 Tax=Parelaphostrongylus tenuis TaxID=148309 RepID=A0AAD5RCX5_PARTN|nr:hypothetical protein KIN20_036147 [Parelaphostrongylus tenuis]
MSSNLVLSSFDIILDAGDDPIFKGGEVITGKLRIALRRPIVINAVKLQLKGRATWLNDPLKKDDIEKVYFDQDFTLLERPPGKPEPGHFTWIGGYPYTLPFECPLPKGCPMSYEGPYAFIRYFIKASLIHEEDDGGTKEYYVKKAFPIVPPSEGYLLKGEPIVVNQSALYGSCCCRGKLSVELSLPKTGYLPGEDVVGKLKIGNKYPKDILQNVEIRLVDRVVRIGAPERSATSPYRTLYYRKNKPTKIIKGAGDIEKDDFYLLTIPAVCPSTKGDFDAVKNEVHSLSPSTALMESPSTATLRFRKLPFIKIEYAIQVSLGNIVLLEAPITVGELSTNDPTTVLKSFVGGPQPIQEAEEAKRISVGGPFMYTPVYPIMATTSDDEPKSKNDGVPNNVSITTEEVIRSSDTSSSPKEGGFEIIVIDQVKVHQKTSPEDSANTELHRSSGDFTQQPQPRNVENEETVEVAKENGTTVIRTVIIKDRHDDYGSAIAQVQSNTTEFSVGN